MEISEVTVYKWGVELGSYEPGRLKELEEMDAGWQIVADFPLIKKKR